jgi:hypothetical protein
MKEKKHPLQAKNKYAKLIYFIALPVLIITLVILFYQGYLRSALTIYVENLLEEKIASQLDLASVDLIDVNIQKLKFNAFPITVSTPEISIYAATKVYNEDYSAKPCIYVYEAGIINFEISLKPLVLIALGQRKFNVNRLRADSVYYSTKCISKKPEVVFNSQLKFQSGPIAFKGKIEMSDHESNAIENLIFKKHSFQAANLSICLPKKLHSYHLGSISLDGTKSTISMEKFKILPKYPKEELYKHVDFVSNRIEIQLDYIEINGFHTHTKHGRIGLMISQVNIKNGFIDAFRDKRSPLNEELRPPMPTRLILSAPFDLFVAEINISETDIMYSKYPEKSSKSEFREALGKVPINRLKATVRNMTNISDSLQKDSIMHISGEALTFDDAILRANFRYNLKDINGGYSAEAEVSELRFETINPALYPLTGMRISRGIHKKSVLSFTGNDVESRGELFMEWNDLALDLTPDASNVISGITKSFGKLLYHQSNPDNENKNPSGEIYYERDITRFVFHYWWNCYFSGIKNSVLRDYVPL